MTTEVQKQPSKSLTLGEFLASKKNQLQAALPKHMTADRLLRVAMTEVRKNPKLQECTQESFFSSLLQSGQLGIEPGSVLGHGHLVPYKNFKKNITECQFILGYRGMIDLARRSGEIASISAHEVYENDHFEFEYGITERLRHIPTDGETGKIVKFYAIAKFKDGGYQFIVMPKNQVDAIRERSKSKDNGPWVTDYVAMGIKTVLRNLFKFLPISIEIREALSREDEDSIEVDFSVVKENEENSSGTKADNFTKKLEKQKSTQLQTEIKTEVKAEEKELLKQPANPADPNDPWLKQYDGS